MRLVVLAALLSGCATDISGAEARRSMARGALLVDVRSRAEFKERPVRGAVNLPIEELKRRLAELPRNRRLIVYCHTGARAGAAALILRKAGVRDVRNVGSIGRLVYGSNEAPPLF
ncbi:MAG TPA: rhodanese-like domain-containing protein [Kofleriaceae bacterium]|nr:rhodanese-like domain-containing protein [Kofleriaceae bacterium]